MNELCCILIFGVVIVFATLGIIFWCCQNLENFRENFSPTGWTRDCPHGTVGSMRQCGPGCWTKSKIFSKGCKVKEPKVRGLPLGWGGTVTGPYAGPSGCTSNVNGVMKRSKRNPYGQVEPQMYGMCVMGSENAFDNDK